jgi:hypothetical protein
LLKLSEEHAAEMRARLLYAQIAARTAEVTRVNAQAELKAARAEVAADAEAAVATEQVKEAAAAQQVAQAAWDQATKNVAQAHAERAVVDGADYARKMQAYDLRAKRRHGGLLCLAGCRERSSPASQLTGADTGSGKCCTTDMVQGQT